MCFTVVSSYSTSDVCPIFQTICDDKLVVMSAAACTSWVTESQAYARFCKLQRLY